ncbi:MAG TPA: hypothetical protein VE422_27300 [Terriglobia bacterium]|nr:hypothetical protein [Terriglobia bacterium]
MTNRDCLATNAGRLVTNGVRSVMTVVTKTANDGTLVTRLDRPCDTRDTSPKPGEPGGAARGR